MPNTISHSSIQQFADQGFLHFVQQVASGINVALKVVIDAQADREADHDDQSALLSVTSAYTLIGLCQASAALLADKAGLLAEHTGSQA